MIKILYKSELGGKLSREEFDADLTKLLNLPPNDSQYGAIVHIGKREFYVVYESDQLMNPNTLVAGTEDEIVEAVKGMI
jgi:hypothetical protein